MANKTDGITELTKVLAYRSFQKIFKEQNTID